LKPDPRTNGFDATPPETLRRLSKSQQAQYFDRGYFLLKDALSLNEVEAMREAGDVLEAEREEELRREHDGHFLINRADDITFTTHVVTRSEVAHRFAQLEVFKDLCSELIGPGAILYWDQLVYKKPETDEEFPWHQDNGYTFVSPEAYLTCWVPLTEATEENGCPWVIPRAHLLGTLKHWSTPLGLQCVNSSDELPNTPAAVEASPGDIVVFSSLTPHRTGPNLTDACRKAFILQYAARGAVMHPRGGDPIQLPFDDRRHISMAIA